MKISLIITTYNRPDALNVVLKSVSNQSLLPDEVLIADDGSTEDTAHVIQSYQQQFPIPLTHCHHPDLGFRVSHIRNKAIREAKGEYFILTDGDMVLHKDFVKDHAVSAKPKCFIQGSRVLLDEVTTQKTIAEHCIHFSWYSKGITNRFNAMHNGVAMRALNALKTGKKDHHGIRSCNMSAWKKDIIDINGFNEEFVGWGREDSEFAVRLLNAGIHRLNLRFGAICYHLWHKSNQENALLTKNDAVLEKAIAEESTWCKQGIISEQ
jgi:glycosyltransferase involved in cell wall biosynthesis